VGKMESGKSVKVLENRVEDAMMTQTHRGSEFNNGGESMEESFLVIAYDLPSENQLHISRNGKSTEIYSKVRSTRVVCTYSLHGLGLMCTESVILVSPSKFGEVDKVVEKVKNSYEELNKWLKDNNVEVIGDPLIKVIKVNREQKEDLVPLAERKVKERLDELIELIVNLINELESMVEEERRKKIEYNVNKQMRELSRIETFCRELGISTNHKLELLGELYNQALSKLKEGGI
jgi:hypothetical protein